MFAHLYDPILKATETTLTLQQGLWRVFAAPWRPAPVSIRASEVPWPDQFDAFRGKWARSLDDLRERHRETLDARREAGLRAIRAAFREGRGGSTAALRRGVEAAWAGGIASIRAETDRQLDEFRAAGEAWFEAVARVLPPSAG